MGRLFVVADAPWGKVIHNLGSLTLQSFITSFGPRSMNNFGPPIRDYRTQPGVLTPGVDKKRRRPEGVVESLLQIGKALTGRAAGPNYLPPFQGGSSLNVFLGLKPQAESCSPL